MAEALKNSNCRLTEFNRYIRRISNDNLKILTNALEHPHCKVNKASSTLDYIHQFKKAIYKRKDNLTEKVKDKLDDVQLEQRSTKRPRGTMQAKRHVLCKT